MNAVGSRDAERVRHELQTQGFSVCRQLLPAASVAGAIRKIEAAVDRHLTAAVASGEIAGACEGLPIEYRIAQAYAACLERAPASWVNQVKGTVAFQHHLFRNEPLCALVEALTGRPAVVASRFNCRCKLRDSASANFPWHQDHAFFRMQYLLKKQEPLRLLAAWAPFVPVDAANGAVELCPVRSARDRSLAPHSAVVLALALALRPLPHTGQASHKLGFVRHGQSGGFLAARQRPPLPERLAGVVPSLQPGDVLLFTDLTLHRSGANTTLHARWSADWAYELLASDAICPSIEPPARPAEVAVPASPGATVPASADVEQRECACSLRPAKSSAAECPVAVAATTAEPSKPEQWLRLFLTRGDRLRLGLAASVLTPTLIAVAVSWVGRRRRP